MNNKKINRILITFLLVDIGLFGAYGYLFYITDAKNTATAALYTTSQEQSSDREKIQGLVRVLKETEEDRNKLSGYFITKTNAVTFIEQIEKVGQDAGVTLTVDSVSDKTTDSGAIQLNFSATGAFTHLYHLVALVESMPYKVTVKKAQVQRINDEKTAQSDWRGSFTVTMEGFVSGSTATTTPQ